MNRILSTASILVFIGILIVPRSRCQAQPCFKENEVYTDCASSSCFEETCEDILFAKPGPKKCTKDCKRGCKCQEGYFRNYDGRCVNELTCIMCGYQENWVEFDNDSYDYEMICEDLIDNEKLEESNEVETEEPSFPPDVFDGNEEFKLEVYGGMCNCAKDMYRSVDGLCVSEESCLQCGVNEIYEGCGSSTCWEYTCDDVFTPLRDRLIRPCTLDCRSGCKCHSGFYRQISSGQCVTAAVCLEELA